MDKMLPDEKFGLVLKMFRYLPLLKRLLLVGEAVFPLTMMVLGLLGLISPDLAIASISITFSAALVPGVVQCYRGKFGWSKQSCTMTGFGLLSMGVLFYYVAFAYGAPLFLTATTTMMSASMWMVLLAQAFKYAKPNFAKIANENKDVLTSPESILAQVPQLGDTFGDQLKAAMSPENLAELQRMAKTLFGGNVTDESGMTKNEQFCVNCGGHLSDHEYDTDNCPGLYAKSVFKSIADAKREKEEEE